MKTIERKNRLSCVYILGVIGAGIYYTTNAASFGVGVLGLLKSIVWPVFMVHGIFTHYSL